MEVDSVKERKADEPLSIRITSGGKMKSWIEVVLKSLKENPEKPILLHTLPHATKRDAPEAATKVDPQKDKEIEDSEKATSTHQPSVSNIPRLASIVEIIKREYLKELPQSLVKSGLYQYNRLGVLEENESARDANQIQSEEERTNEILAALSGSNNNLKIQKTPYMQTMLSVKPQEGLDSTWTVQDPITHKLSRNARYRFKKREQKDEHGNENMETDGDV
ncbi:hypothetical protein SCHPADRAFT_910801 [Schizopora paradoxa]|uniref:Uncharacterized protein n=1 Tax=Schizopora paradoxa TaxID=27342 RepID=A0A0H2R8C1_9AGAM|nr:hypothetical protein SCHPADRAFT_910801 [Schizopora paradoxa]